MKNPNITFPTIFMALGLVALSPIALAVSPAPEGGYPGGNTAEGQNALRSLTSGTNNTSVGFLSLLTDTTGALNTALGAGALLANTGDENTATGAGALLNNTTGTINTAAGAFALASNTTGIGNTAIGVQALFSNITGTENTAIGYSALGNNSDGIGNTAVGFDALSRNSASGNTAIGRSALASNIIGTANTAIGFSALALTTGSSNTAMGLGALGINAAGNNNTAIGTGALANNTSGSNNIAIGVNAGSNIVTASDTICIGYPGVDVTDGCYIGHVFEEPLNPDNLPMAIDVNGKVGTLPSSRRFKDDIKPMDKTSEAILALKPVTFRYKSDKNCNLRFGLIAEEVAEVNSSLVALDKEGKPFSVRYDQVNAMLLNEFLKEHRKVESQEHRIREQEARITELMSIVTQDEKSFQSRFAEQENQVKTLASNLQKVNSQIKMREAAAKTVVANP